MAERIGHNFLDTSEASTLSYDFVDIASGQAMKVFYPMTANEDTDQVYILSPSILDSQTTSTVGTDITEQVMTMHFDKDFDMIFNTPRTVEGQALVVFTGGMDKINGDDNDVTIQWVAKFQKYSGTTETAIAHLSGTNWVDEVTAAGPINKEFTFAVTLPKTHFAINDKLRLTIQGLAKTNAAATDGRLGMAHDPSNRNDDYRETGAAKIIGDAYDTKMTVAVPFRLQE